MRRLLVAGARGFFGAAAAGQLRALGAEPLETARSKCAQAVLDVESPASLRAVLRAGDVVLDAAGPFQERSTALAEAAIEYGCDVVDLSDSLHYAERLTALAGRIGEAGIRVLNSASSVSAVTAALVKASGTPLPARACVLLAPAARYSGSRGTSASLLHSVGREVRVWQDGRLAAAQGWQQARRVELGGDVGTLHGWLCESADAFWLPRIWPSLRRVEFYVDTRVAGLNALLAAAAKRAWLRGLAGWLRPAGVAAARRLGSRTGCLAVEVEDKTGCVRRAALLPGDRGHLAAVAPAVLAALALAQDRFVPRGLVPPDQHAEHAQLLGYLESLGMRLWTSQ